MDDEQSAADALARAIETAIQNVLTERGGGMLTGYTGVINYMDADGERAWATVHLDGQAPWQTLGLLRYQTLVVEREINAYLTE